MVKVLGASGNVVQCGSPSVLIHPHLLGEGSTDYWTSGLRNDQPGRQPSWHAVPEQCMVVESSAQGKELLPSLVHISACRCSYIHEYNLAVVCMLCSGISVGCKSQQCFSEF